MDRRDTPGNERENGIMGYNEKKEETTVANHVPALGGSGDKTKGRDESASLVLLFRSTSSCVFGSFIRPREFRFAVS